MINKCLFPAAGYGTRFLPATKAVPKEMLPILTKPLLQYGVEEALSAGITNMAIVQVEVRDQLKITLIIHLSLNRNLVAPQKSITWMRLKN